MSIEWHNTGIDFPDAITAGAFINRQGFQPCNGGWRKRDDLDGGEIFASYVLTNRRCYIRIGREIEREEN